MRRVIVGIAAVVLAVGLSGVSARAATSPKFVGAYTFNVYYPGNHKKFFAYVTADGTVERNGAIFGTWSNQRKTINIEWNPQPGAGSAVGVLSRQGLCSKRSMCAYTWPDMTGTWYAHRDTP